MGVLWDLERVTNSAACMCFRGSHQFQLRLASAAQNGTSILPCAEMVAGRKRAIRCVRILDYGRMLVYTILVRIAHIESARAQQ